ncbi:unnamed protein product [Ectocarpus sp. 6 AP-2014]
MLTGRSLEPAGIRRSWLPHPYPTQQSWSSFTLDGPGMPVTAAAAGEPLTLRRCVLRCSSGERAVQCTHSKDQQRVGRFDPCQIIFTTTMLARYRSTVWLGWQCVSL